MFTFPLFIALLPGKCSIVFSRTKCQRQTKPVMAEGPLTSCVHAHIEMYSSRNNPFPILPHHHVRSLNNIERRGPQMPLRDPLHDSWTDPVSQDLSVKHNKNQSGNYIFKNWVNLTSWDPGITMPHSSS